MRRIGRVPKNLCESCEIKIVSTIISTHLVRVSVSWPLMGSRTVRSRTPFCKPMLTNVVGETLLIPASSMSAMQMADGGAVRACKLMVSSVLSGSSETMRTVWSSHPTALSPIEVSAHHHEVHKCLLTRYGVRCLPSGTSAMLRARTVLPIAFRS